MTLRVRPFALIAVLWLGCSAGRPTTQSYLGGEAVDFNELTAAEVARAVHITPRDHDVFFQAPTIQTSKLIDLRSAGKEIGIALGDVERVRIGYLSGLLDPATGTVKHFLLFQSNFVTGDDRYKAVTVDGGRALEFTVARAPDPCIPNCFPVVEALVVFIPDAILRANTSTGLPLIITLSTGDTISVKGLPTYVQGYLQAVDAYRAK